jgi:anti-anti-sigma regulatory factor
MPLRGKADREVAEVSVYGDAVVLTLTATHYHSDSMEVLAAALAAADGQSPSGQVVVDMALVQLLSSTALRALRAAHLALEARGGRIMAASGKDLVRGVLKFAPFIVHHDTVETALRSQSVEAAALYVREKGR